MPVVTTVKGTPRMATGSGTEGRVLGWLVTDRVGDCTRHSGCDNRGDQPDESASLRVAGRATRARLSVSGIGRLDLARAEQKQSGVSR